MTYMNWLTVKSFSTRYFFLSERKKGGEGGGCDVW